MCNTVTMEKQKQSKAKAKGKEAKNARSKKTPQFKIKKSLRAKYKDILLNQPVVVLRDFLIPYKAVHNPTGEGVSSTNKTTNTKLTTKDNKKTAVQQLKKRERKSGIKKQKLDNYTIAFVNTEKSVRKRGERSRKNKIISASSPVTNADKSACNLELKNGVNVYLKDTEFSDNTSNVARFPDYKDAFGKDYPREEETKTMNGNDVNQNEGSYSSCIDFNNFSHTAVNLSQEIFSRNYIVNKFITTVQLPTEAIDSPKYYASIKKEDLASKNDNSSSLTLKKGKQFPIILSEELLPKNSVRLCIKEADVDKGCNGYKTNIKSKNVGFPEQNKYRNSLRSSDANIRESANNVSLPSQSENDTSHTKVNDTFNFETSTPNNVENKSAIRTNVLKLKRAASNQNENGEFIKRCKLDTNNWQIVRNTSETEKPIGTTFDDTAIYNNECNNEKMLSEPMNNENLVATVEETRSETNEHAPGFLENLLINSFKSIDEEDYLLSLNTSDFEEVESNSCELPAEDQIQSNDSEIDNDCDDCISIFANSTLVKECDGLENTSQMQTASTAQQYDMTDKLFDNYYEKTKSEFNEMYNNVPAEITSPPKCKVNFVATRKTNRGVSSKLLSIFRGYCYRMVRTGRCLLKCCAYQHNFLALMNIYYKRDEQGFFKLLEKLVSNNFKSFLVKFFKELSFYSCTLGDYQLKVYKKLYELNIVTDELADNFIRQLIQNGNSLKEIGDQLATLMNDTDSKFINSILNIFKKYAECGEYWIAGKSLFLQLKQSEPEIAEAILQECVITKQHVQDIYSSVLCKFSPMNYSKINQQLLSVFKNLINDQKEGIKTIENNVPLSSFVDPLKKKTGDDNNNDDNDDANNESSSFKLHRIDDLPKPYSLHGRKRFWKFYVDVHGLRKGLEHNDYEYVINILNSVKKDQQSMYSRACYQILCNEIMYSQYRLSKCISLAVRARSTVILYEMLLDVTTWVLTSLVRNNLWVLAYRLLEDAGILITGQIHEYTFDAAVIMLFAAIYIANKYPIQALILLKHNNIICGDRNKWKVKSTVEDDRSRVKLIMFLYDSLCKASKEICRMHAFWLLRCLAHDQDSNFYPIDLSRFANKLISVLLLERRYDLVIRITKLIDDYDFTLDTYTYRALITTLTRIKMPLAMRLYQKAINLRIYSRPKFYPVTFHIINPDWTEEEMFLAVFHFMEQLSSQIGHALDRIDSAQLSVYLVFECTPVKEQAGYDTASTSSYNKNIGNSISLMGNVLKTRFEPSILMMQLGKGRVIQLIMTTVLAYLRSKYCG